MALSSAEKAQVRMYLGLPSFWRYLDYRTEGSLATIDNDPDVEALVRTVLSNLVAVDAKIQQMSLTVAGIKRVDDVEFFKSSQVLEIRKVGRNYVARLSILTGVGIYSDYYGETGYLGDKYSAGGLTSGYGSFKIRLG